jgi:hypothetical protein
MNFKKFEILIGSTDRAEFAIDAFGDKYVIPEHIMNQYGCSLPYPCYAVITEPSKSIYVPKLESDGTVVSDDNGKCKREYLSGIGVGHIFFSFEELKTWHDQSKLLQNL